MSDPSRRRGRPVLGAIAGLVFGLALGLNLWLFGMVPLDSVLLIVLPVLGLLGGIAFALWAPLGRRTTSATPETSDPEVTA